MLKTLGTFIKSKFDCKKNPQIVYRLQNGVILLIIIGVHINLLLSIKETQEYLRKN